MKTRLFVCSALATLVAVVLVGVGSAAAFENVTAQEAYEMVNSGQAILIDVRTLYECFWVGMADVVFGGLYVIPWWIITIESDGTVVQNANPDFDALVQQEFPDIDQTLITMCRSGGRSTFAAEFLKGKGYTNVYEIDNPLSEQLPNIPGGRGGLQGSNYSGAYDGYRGYPKRLPSNRNPHRITVETDTDKVNNLNDSVSWMDTGLPMTQDFDKAVIPTLLR